jgi:hypothetical protein
MDVRRTGPWPIARRLLAALPARLAPVLRAAVAQEAHQLRAQIVDGLTQQAPAGAAFRPLAPLTLAARRLRRFAGTKALLRTGDLRNSIAVLTTSAGVFIGIARSARATDGRSLVDIAQVHEYGTAPIVIPITPSMRRYLAVLFREAGRGRAAGPSAGVVVVQVPARPFLRPVFAAFQRGFDERLLQRAERLLDGLVSS